MSKEAREREKTSAIKRTSAADPLNSLFDAAETAAASASAAVWQAVGSGGKSLQWASGGSRARSPISIHLAMPSPPRQARMTICGAHAHPVTTRVQFTGWVREGTKIRRNRSMGSGVGTMATAGLTLQWASSRLALCVTLGVLRDRRRSVGRSVLFLPPNSKGWRPYGVVALSNHRAGL